VLLDDTIILQGYIDGSSTRQRPLKIQLRHADIKHSSEIRSVFGDLNGPLGLLTWTGHLYTFFLTSDAQLSLTSRSDAASPTLSHVAITGTGRTAIIMLQAHGSRMIHVLEFQTFKNFEQWYADPSSAGEAEDAAQPFTHHMMAGRAVTLLAGATCFVLLTEEGEVLSWGDRRHSRCLGRTPDSENPADKPAVVSALGGIGIAKIDGRGWIFGALSKENDLYLWGRDKPGTEASLGHLLGDVDEEVKLLDDECFEDVQDFAIGNGHVVVGTEGVFAIGENRNGQLSLGKASPESVSTWVKLVNTAREPNLALVAGDASSFMLSSRTSL
jgi:hypothetical protein